MQNNEYMTPQIGELSAKASGNPLHMRGLMHVLSNVYTEGMSIDDLQMGVGLKVQEQLKRSLETLTPEQAQVVRIFLQSVDYTLTLENENKIRSGKSM